MLRYAEDGDISAFEELYSRHKDGVYRYLLRHSGQAETAQDIFQEVWGKVIRARKSYRPSAKFSTFLYRVAHNCFIDHLRRNARHTGHADFEETTVASACPSPEAETDFELLRRRLDAAMAALPREQRDAFLLHEEAGLSIRDIADVTGVKDETAKSRVRYAIGKLKVALQEEER